jgi:hypothetical protein
MVPRFIYNKYDRVVQDTIERTNLVWKKKECGKGCDKLFQEKVTVPITVDKIITETVQEEVMVP